jgi:hypothetical protein
MAARETIAARSGQACEVCRKQKARCRPSNVQHICEKYVSLPHVTFEGVRVLLMGVRAVKSLRTLIGFLPKSYCDWGCGMLHLVAPLLIDVLQMPSSWQGMHTACTKGPIAAK